MLKLTGYRVDLPESRRYHLYSSYTHRSHVLRFQQSAAGEMQLLESEFAQQLGPQMEAYLRERDSIPAFLAATTLALFDEACPPPLKNDENAMVR